MQKQREDVADCNILSKNCQFCIISDNYRLLRHLKYSSSTCIEDSSGTGAGYGASPLRTIVTWLSEVNSGHCGRPSPLGSPYFAKLVQYVAMMSESSKSVSTDSLLRALKTKSTSCP